MKRLLFVLSIAGLIMMTACEPKPESKQITVNNDNLLVATLYHQKAAEMEALCVQAYNYATINLDDILAQRPEASKLAIVLDLDETVLDNSPYEAKCILDNISYPTGWDEWMHLADAKAIPGAVDFLKYTQSKGVQVFYITNRREKYREATLKNLQKLGIPPASQEHLLLRTDESSKESRRQLVLENHEIIMLFGDNLADFSKVFDGEHSLQSRADLVNNLRNEFGSRFIVLPNAMYGDWFNAVLYYDFKLSPAEKLKLQKLKLESF